MVLVAFLIPTEAFSKSAPDWIYGSSKKYPEPRYFIGIGSSPIDRGGPKQQHEWAGDRARAEIAKIIRSEVRVTSSAERKVSGMDQNKRRKSWEGRSGYSEAISVTANEILEGVEIKEYHSDKKSKTLYALAVLDRHKAAKKLEQEIKSIKASIATKMEEGNSLQTTGSFLPALGRYNDALLLTGKASEMNGVLSVLKPAGASPFLDTASYEADLTRLIAQMRSLIRFDVTVEGPALGVKGYIVNGLSKSGITGAASESAPKNYILNGLTDVTYKGTIDMGKDLSMHIYQADIDISVNDPAIGATLGTLIYSASANEKTEELAKKSAVRALGNLIQKKIADDIMNLR